MKFYWSGKYSKYIEFIENLCPRNILGSGIYCTFNWKDGT